MQMKVHLGKGDEGATVAIAFSIQFGMQNGRLIQILTKCNSMMINTSNRRRRRRLTDLRLGFRHKRRTKSKQASIIAIASRAVQVPIKAEEGKRIIGGHHRQNDVRLQVRFEPGNRMMMLFDESRNAARRHTSAMMIVVLAMHLQ